PSRAILAALRSPARVMRVTCRAACRSARAGSARLSRNLFRAAFLAVLAAFCRSAKLGSLKLLILESLFAIRIDFNGSACNEQSHREEFQASGCTAQQAAR